MRAEEVLTLRPAGTIVTVYDRTDPNTVHLHKRGLRNKPLCGAKLTNPVPFWAYLDSPKLCAVCNDIRYGQKRLPLTIAPVGRKEPK